MRRLALLAGLGMLSVAAPASAQGVFPPDEGGDLVHYSYGTLFGTGYYQLDDRSVALIRVPIGFQLRERTPEKFGIRLEVLTAFSLHNFDFKSIPELDLNNLATISVLPGIQFNFLIKERWEVDPSVYLGYGRDISNGISSLIYGGGVTSRYRFNLTKPVLTLGSNLLGSGYTPEDGEARFITRFGIGLDAKIPTRWKIGDRNLFIGTFGIGYVYLNEMEVQSVGSEPITWRNELEIGLALGGDPAFKLFWFEFDRVGLAYRFSDEVDAILLVTRFPF